MLIINPGTEPVEATTAEQAVSNMRTFCEDLGGLDGVSCERRADRDYGDGRYAFLLRRGEATCEIQMPGCDLETVAQGRPWRSPRLYVDGSSWLWGFAVDAAVRALGGGEDR